jgi:hypothetical protein
MFTLADANFIVRNGQLARIPLRARKLMREVEIFPLTRLHSPSLASLFFAIFHPVNAWKEWRIRKVHKSLLDQSLYG